MIVAGAGAGLADSFSMEITRSVTIARPVEAVFNFVADARNDPAWCPKVQTVRQIEGAGPGPGARFAVVHRPVPLRPAREMEYRCLAWRAPNRIDWREDDGTDVVLVTYELEELGPSTRLIQRDEAELGAPRLLRPLMRVGIGHDLTRQLRALKALLEGEAAQPASGVPARASESTS